MRQNENSCEKIKKNKNKCVCVQLCNFMSLHISQGLKMIRLGFM